MSAVLKTMTAQEYLVRERQAEFKSEFYKGEVFEMAGGSPMHSLIGANFVRAAGNGLSGSRCNVFNSDLRVRVNPSGLYTYPDASVICGKLCSRLKSACATTSAIRWGSYTIQII